MSTHDPLWTMIAIGAFMFVVAIKVWALESSVRDFEERIKALERALDYVRGIIKRA